MTERRSYRFFNNNLCVLGAFASLRWVLHRICPIAVRAPLLQNNKTLRPLRLRAFALDFSGTLPQPMMSFTPTSTVTISYTTLIQRLPLAMAKWAPA